MNNKISKTALVLAGGGLTGAVYEVGALQAIDDILIDRTVKDFDIYIGTSSGALVSAFIANGVSPETLLKILDGSHPLASALDRRLIFKINWKEYARWIATFPRALLKEWFQYIRNLRDSSFLDMVWSLSEAIPTGLYDGSALERLVRQGLSRLGCSNDFRDLGTELYLIATDLITGERAIFGMEYNESTISQAVAASSAMPFLYRRMQINGRDYVDGGLRGSASIDLAIERGANLVVVINPMVSFDHSTDHQKVSDKDHQGYVGDGGVQSLANRVIRIALHSGLQYHIKQVRRAYPHVDIILIEPSPEESHMFTQNIMRYSARTHVANHGYESVTIHLAQDFTGIQKILKRHGIPISRRLAKEELDIIINSGHDPRVIQRVLEDRSHDSSHSRHDGPLSQLEKTLAELDLILDHMTQVD